MNPDETQEVLPETPEQEAVAQEATDPLDTIEDINELRSKAKALRSQANRYKRDAKDKPQLINKEVPTTRYNILDDEVADLILGGYNKEETRFILANGGRKALEDKNSFVAVAINSKREQRNAEEAGGQTSNASSGYVDAERKVTLDQLKNMTAAEMAKVLPHT